MLEEAQKQNIAKIALSSFTYPTLPPMQKKLHGRIHHKNHHQLHHNPNLNQPINQPSHAFVRDTKIILWQNHSITIIMIIIIMNIAILPPQTNFGHNTYFIDHVYNMELELDVFWKFFCWLCELVGRLVSCAFCCLQVFICEI